ncbi:MAG: replication-associated recombination protein A [Eubacteriales bacterium]|nr:replication-associated recombination protein A [Eubacteriales bacterium]
MDLFEYMETKEKAERAPLAYRMRPEKLDDFIGQEHIIGPGKLLRRCIEADRLRSVILYGPPGTGKTSLATVIANTTKASFVTVNATVAGKKDLQEVVKRAKEVLAMYGKRTILFIDEIHRFNKGQQDFLLPYVEEGVVTLIGATTENPYFEVNSALVSRSGIFQLKKLSEADILKMTDIAVRRGYPDKQIDFRADARGTIARLANGDARRAYNAVELAVLTTPPDENGVIVIDAAVVHECMQAPRVNYDKGGDNHYDTISAFIKSMRGSDPDAVLYYLAKMLYAGEDVKFIARRIMICAAEDVSLADPMALVVAVNAAAAVERIGMPEGRIILAEAAVYVAMAPKSNATYMGIDAAMAAVKEGDFDVPAHLRDGSYTGAASLGHGQGYKYAHSYTNHYVKQQYLPDELVDRVFYQPTDSGAERAMRDFRRRLEEEADE